jgi:uncharacterized protein
MLSKIVFALFGAFACFNVALAQTAPGLVPRTTVPPFDCSKARKAPSRLICADEDLARLDVQLAAAIEKKKADLPPDEQKQFDAAETKLIQERNRRCNLVDKDTDPVESLASSKGCILTAIQERIKVLTSGPASGASATQAHSATAASSSSLGADELAILNVLRPTFPSTDFCQSGPMKVIGVGDDRWAVASFFDKKTCVHESDNDSYTAILRRTRTDEWTLVCKEQRGDLPDADYFFKQCGMPADAYRSIFGVGPTSATAQAKTYEFKSWQVDCSHMAMGGGADLEVDAVIDPANSHWFLDEVPRTIAYMSERLKKDCAGKAQYASAITPALALRVRECIGCPVTFNADTYRDRNNWVIEGNSYQAKQQAQRIAQAKENLRNGFIAKYGIQQWANRSNIAANPFVFKDKVVGIVAMFGRMISENEAVFGNIDCASGYAGYCGDAVTLSNVPPTAFTGKENLVIAIKVLGTRTISAPNGNTIVPDLKYLGSFKCQFNDCSDFFGSQ